MRDLYQLLLEKEQEITRVRQEIAALRSILPLLVDDDDSPAETPLRAAANRE
jgi:predicted dithiol-disulfide oxidoreductase (DUF899 family)